MCAAPNVQIKEVDLSTRVPSFPGVYGGIVIPAKKGPINEPFLVDGDTSFLKKFTPDEKVEVGYDLSYFSALAYLEKANRLWVVRAALNALFGGAEIKVKTATSPNHSSAVSTGFSDPTAYTFDATASNEGAILLYGANEGEWNNGIAVKIWNYESSPDIVKEEGAFLIQVFKTTNLNVAIESWTCSRVQGHKDGFGQNIYVEDILQGSEYIRAFDNVLVDEDVLPEEVTTALQFDKGDDGSAVTDSEMVEAAGKFENPEDIFVTILMDGGWATPVYQKELDRICGVRKDSVAILSTPYSAEASSSYLTELQNYRKVTLNLNSSYSALYSPHAKIYDKFNDRSLFVAPDGYAAVAISETAANYEIWFPPAGFKRGQVNVLDLRRRFSQTEMDALYDTGINPLRFAPGRGILIWGQKTLLSRPSTLDRLNVRLLLIVIEPATKFALEDFLFDINDEATRSLASAVVESYMDNIQARRGVTEYSVVCDSTNNSDDDINNHRMNLWLFVRPSQSLEYIKFIVVVTKEGLSFELAAQQLGG